jgi:hypothetical protein
MSARPFSGFGRDRRGTRRLPILVALLYLPLITAGAETRSREVERILDAAPRGARERAAWLTREAMATRDARVAFELAEEANRHAPADAAVPARLWKVRYWMAAARTDQAMLELQALGEVPEGAPGAQEASCWRALLGLESRPAESGAEVPPWGLMARLARMRDAADGRGRGREALALEGAVRRMGLLGPWLWRLMRARDGSWQRSVREALAGSAHALEAAPERIALEQGTRP